MIICQMIIWVLWPRPVPPGRCEDIFYFTGPSGMAPGKERCGEVWPGSPGGIWGLMNDDPEE